jgi:cyclophilin family peptidyl-prolyl cis-trans isomerase
MSKSLFAVVVATLIVLPFYGAKGAEPGPKSADPAPKPVDPAPKAARPATQTAEPAAKAPAGPAAEEFAKVFREWKDLLGELGSLRVQYHKANPKDRSEIEKKWNDLIARGEAMQDRLIEAAEEACTEAPNPDKQVTDLLTFVLWERFERDDYERVLPLAKLLIEKQRKDKWLCSVAGIAAYATEDLDSAAEYLAKAKDNEEALRNSSSKVEKRMADLGEQFRENLVEHRKALAKERKIRQAEAKADLPRVLLKTSQGDIEVELFENEAPNTVANFISLVEKGFYDGRPFHRVLPGFMAQGGCPKGDGSGGPGYRIPCECYQPNHRLHFRGSLSMANTGRRDTGGSQFFLTFVPTTFLDGRHTVFGRVVEGMDVLAKLQRVDPASRDEQPKPDKIIEAKVLRKRPHKYVVKKVEE